MKHFDWNAGAPLRPAVLEHLQRAFADQLGNPSSVHGLGRAARRLLEDARRRAAAALGVGPKELIFTSSGSAAAALALRGAFFARKDRSRSTVVVSAIEHPSVLEAAKVLTAHGATLRVVQPRPDGVVDAAAFEQALDASVAVASLMWANNETGVLQPVEAVAERCERLGVIFHTDAVQAVGRVPVSLRAVHAPLLSFSSHKLGGPAGVGFLICAPSVQLEPLVPGHQEGGRQAGTPNVALLGAAALALELCVAELGALEAAAARRDAFERAVLASISGVEITGGTAPRLPTTSNLRFDGLAADALLMALDLEGFAVSTGAACASGSVAPSHVLTAMGLSAEQARSALRVSFGLQTPAEALSALAGALTIAVQRARAVR